MASTSSSHQQNAFSGIEPLNKTRKVEESSRVYDVFINHRGPDAKQTLAAKLYKSLEERNIRAFLDSEERELGTSFPSTIETAIRSARVHIAIFSKGYAESPWCLAELHLMSQSTAKIIPIFYQVEPFGVKPSDLRHIETGVYKDAFLKYQTKGRYTEKIKGWKDALQSVSFTAGYEFSASSDCKEIVSAVEKEVERRIHLFVATHPVGLNKLLEDFERKCRRDLVEGFHNQCRMNRAGKERANVVGIFGMGGVGKTTLAKELFNQKKPQYTKASFLFDVREASKRSELPDLQSKLLHDIFGEKEHKFRSLEEGTICLRNRLERSGSPSFLVILDDIDHVEQLEALLPMDILNGNGNCLVIVTTRDVGVLVTAEIEIAYHLKGLQREDGKALFCWHAFGQPDPRSGYEDLVEEFVNTCGGLPLSLQVLGRHVHKRDPQYWREELKKARETLPEDIKKRLKISIDSLDNEEKQVFMDVACFFIGELKTMAMSIWEGSGWRSHHALETLKDKCLLEEVETWGLPFVEWRWNTGRHRFALRMHDHLRDLGREMANELSHPPHPRRVWQAQHLKTLELKGFQTILAQTEGRCLHSIWDEPMGCQITYFIEKQEGVTDTSLLWLQLDYQKRSTFDLNSDVYRSIPSWIPLQNLQCLRIRGGIFRRLWQRDMQAPIHLKELYISESFLEEFPDFLGKSNNMKEVVLSARYFQMDILSLLGSLPMNLKSLNVMDSSLTGELASPDTAVGTTFESLSIRDFKLPREGELAFNNESLSRAMMSSLENLEIKGQNLVTKILITGNCCQSLQSLKICKMENLVEADLAKMKTLKLLEITDCKKLNTLTLSKLVELKIENCTELQGLTFVHLSSLERISINSCETLKNFSEIPNVTKLLKLNTSEKDEPWGLNFLGLSNLKWIQIKNHSNLKRLSGIPDHNKLTHLYIEGCTQLEELPSFSRLSSLEQLKIGFFAKLQNITLPTTLVSLSARSCRELRRLVANCELTELKRLKIEECPELEDLPSLSIVSCIDKIVIRSCDKLKNISLPITLNYLFIERCRNLERVAAAGDITELEWLIIEECPELEDLPSLSRVSCIDEIEIYSCDKLKNISLPIKLSSLSIERCRNLERVAAAGDITELTRSNIDECPELEDLSSLSRVSGIDQIVIRSCDKLKNISLPITLNRLSIERCRNLERVAAAGDITEFTRLNIDECPELENSALSLTQFVIHGCEKLESIPGIIELHASGRMDICYCSNALIKNCIDKLKCVPWSIRMIGRAADGAESTLNQNLFIEADIGIDRVTEIYRGCSSFGYNPVIKCFLVAVDSPDSALHINDGDVPGPFLEKCQGEWIITTVQNQPLGYDHFAGKLLADGIVKGFQIEFPRVEDEGCIQRMTRVEEERSIQVLRTIVDRLHYF